jgi:hypothetical protein
MSLPSHTSQLSFYFVQCCITSAVEVVLLNIRINSQSEVQIFLNKKIMDLDMKRGLCRRKWEIVMLMSIAEMCMFRN